MIIAAPTRFGVERRALEVVELHGRDPHLQRARLHLLRELRDPARQAERG